MRWLFGGSHAIAHLLVMLGSVYVVAHATAGFPDRLYVLANTVVLFLAGGLAGTWLVALYLLVADRFGQNTNELFAAQHIEGYNNFLRMHIGQDGALTLYPVKIQNVTRWQFEPDGDAATPWFRPKKEPPEPELIEEPLRFEPLSRAESSAVRPPNVR